MRNTADDALTNIRCGVARLVKSALSAGATHSEILSSLSQGIDRGARGHEPPKIAPKKPRLVPKVATAVMILLLSVAGVADARGALRITTRSLPNAHAGVFYVVHLQAKGGHGRLFWTETGTLPPGLSMSPDGVISGTPEGLSQTYEFQVTVKDSRGFRSQVVFGHWEAA